MEPVEEREYKSEASHLVVIKHLRSPICAEEAPAICERVKRVHDLVKIVVPCKVFEIESTIPPDRGTQLGSNIGVFDDHQHVVVSQMGMRYRSEVDRGRTEAVSSDINKPTSIDITSSASINITSSTSIDTRRESEHNEFLSVLNTF